MEPYEIKALAQRIEQAIGTDEGNDGEAFDALQELTEAYEQTCLELDNLRTAVYDASKL